MGMLVVLDIVYCSLHDIIVVPYNWKIWWRIKSGGLPFNRQIKHPPKFLPCIIIIHIYIIVYAYALVILY